MRPLESREIRGNWATLLSVWKDDGSLDLRRVGDEIDTLIAMRVDGIYSHGSAGEFHAHTEAEFDAVAGLLAEKCNAAGMPFQIGASHMSAQISRERLQRVVPLGPGAVQVILPDWFAVSDQEAVAFLSAMADTAAGIGLVLYNPPHSKRVLGPESVGDLARHVPALVGWKTAGGDDAWYAAMRRHVPQLSVFVPGHVLASGVARGAHGAYSNVACLSPLAAQRWSEQMRTDMAGALELEARLRRFMDTCIAPFIMEGGFSHAACDRFLAVLGGWADVGDRVRWPYRSIPASEVARLRPRAEEMVPEFMTREPPHEGNRWPRTHED